MNALSNITQGVPMTQETWTPCATDVSREARKHLAALARKRLAVRRNWKAGLRGGLAIAHTSFDDLLALSNRIDFHTKQVRELIAMAPKKGGL